MKSVVISLLLMLPVSLAACGSGPAEGGSCTTPDALQCASPTRVLVCEGGRWNGYACPSCAGGKCDWKGAANGDSCPKVADTYGTCILDGRVVACYWSAIVDAGLFVESACPACMAGKSIEELGRCTTGRCSCQ